MHIRWAALLRTLGVAGVFLLTACTGGEDSVDGNVDATTTTTTPIAPESTTTTTPPATAESDLQRVVADAWTAIWVRDWPAVIGVFDADCQSRLSPADFDATLGMGVDALVAGGIDPTETSVKVQVDELIEGESANVTSVLLFPGFDEPEEDDTGEWVVEGNEWRRTDCDDVAGAAGGDTSDLGADEDAEQSSSLGNGPGSSTQPASLGSVFAFEGWRGAIVDVIDANPFLADFSEPVPAGETYLMVVSELQYTGARFAEPDPFLVRAIGSVDYESFDNACALDPQLLDAQGIVPVASAMPGQLLLTASCLSVPTDEIPTLRFVLENVFGIADPEVYYSVDGVEADPLPPADVAPSDPAVDARSFGEVVPLGEEFTGTVVSIHDGVADGLVLGSGEPPGAAMTHAVVIWEGTYLGAEDGVTDPFVAVGLGSGVFEFQWSPCVVDLGAVEAAHGVTGLVDLVTGDTFRGATCFTMPVVELDSVVVQLDNVFDFDAEPVRFLG